MEQFGALGLGFGKGVNSDQPNIIDELVSQGAIQTKAFSLALGSHGPEEGSLILGGIDTKKFAGSLQRLPLVDPPEFTFDFNQTQLVFFSFLFFLFPLLLSPSHPLTY